MDNFFKGLTIIELSSVLAGPSVGMFFAELGATVIKIENSKTPPKLRRKEVSKISKFVKKKIKQSFFGKEPDFR